MSKLRVLILILVLVLAACGGGDEEEDNGDDSGGGSASTTTIRVEANNIESVFQRVLAPRTANPILTRVTDVHVEEGNIRIDGTYRDADGNIVEGGFDQSFSVVDGEIISELTNLEIGDIAADDERISNLNNTLVRTLRTYLPESEVPIEVVSISFTSEGLAIEIVE
jgi:hypothetical protein